MRDIVGWGQLCRRMQEQFWMQIGCRLPSGDSADTSSSQTDPVPLGGSLIYGLSLCFQWLCSVVALQCSILKHLSAKQMSSLWDSEQAEKADAKPVIAADGSLASSYQAADKANLPSIYAASCTPGITTQNSLGTMQDDAHHPSCTDRPKKASPSGTANGPSATSEVKINGPHFCSDSSAHLTDSSRLSGQGGTVPVLSHRQPWPRPTTPPAACGLLNHMVGAVIKTENVAGPVSCTHRGSVPITGGLPASIPSSCTSLEVVSTLQRKNAQTQIGPLLGTDPGTMDSPLTATRALTPPQVTAGDGLSAIGATHGFCSPAPPAGEFVKSPGRASKHLALLLSATSLWRVPEPRQHCLSILP